MVSPRSPPQRRTKSWEALLRVLGRDIGLGTYLSTMFSIFACKRRKECQIDRLPPLVIYTRTYNASYPYISHVFPAVSFYSHRGLDTLNAHVTSGKPVAGLISGINILIKVISWSIRAREIQIQKGE